MKQVCVMMRVAIILSLAGSSALGYGSDYQRPNQQDFYTTADQQASLVELRRADKKLKKKIAYIRNALRTKLAKKNQAFDMHLRMARLYEQRYDNAYRQAQLKFSKSMDVWQKKRRGAKPKFSARKATNHLAKASNIYRKVHKSYPRHPRKEAVTLALGSVHARLLNSVAATYLGKIRKRGTSKLEQEATRALADYHFDKGQTSQAASLYQELIDEEAGRFRAYAYYKTGVIQVERGMKKKAFAPAVTSFGLALQSLEDNDKEQVGSVDLKDGVVATMTLVWTTNEDMQQAERMLGRLDREEDFFNVLAAVGEKQRRAKRNSQAIKTYEKLVEVAPDREDTPTTQQHLLALYDSSKNIKKIVATFTSMNERYVESSSWTRQHQTKKRLLKKTRQNLQKDMYTFAAKYHKLGQKPRNMKYLASAATLYTMHMESFPKAKQTYNAQYFYADIMFEFKKYDIAAENYTAVAKNKRYKSLRRSAALNAVVANGKIDAQQKYAKLPPPAQVPEPIEVPAVKQQLVDSLDTFVRLMPHDKAGRPMQFNAAQILFDYGHYAAAQKRYERIIKLNPGSSQAKTAAKILLAYHVERKDWEKTTQLSRNYLENKRLMNGDLRKHINGVLRRVSYRDAVAQANEGKHQKAAGLFIDYQEDFPRDKLADHALSQAAKSFYKAGLLEDALKANLKLSRVYPKSKLRPQSMLEVAQTYEALAKYGKAARAYRSFAVVFPNSEQASTAVYKAGDLNRGLDRHSDALSAYNLFLSRYPKDARGETVNLRVAEVYEAAGKWKAAEASYAGIARRSPKNSDESFFAAAKSAEIAYRHLDAKKGRREMNRLQAQLRTDTASKAFEARRIVAGLLFQDAEPVFAGYKRVKVDGSKLDVSTKQKQARMKTLVRVYDNIVRLGNPEYTVASLYRTGELHELFANDISAAAPPANLSELKMNRFRAAIDKVALPLKEQAMDYYEQAFKQSQEVETFTAWTRRTYDKMASLEPGKYPEVYEQSSAPSYMAHKMSWQDAVAPLAH